MRWNARASRSRWRELLDSYAAWEQKEAEATDVIVALARYLETLK